MKYCHHFTNEETEAWRGFVPRSRLTISLGNPTFESKQFGTKSTFLTIVFVILPLIYLVPLLNCEVEATLNVPCLATSGEK